MFGFWQIVIVAVIVLILFNYKRLPGLGRSAGEGVNQLKGSVGEMVGDQKLDPATLGKSAGKGVREFREFKDALTGAAEVKPATEPAPVAEPAAEAKPDRDEPEPVEGELVDGTRPA